MQLNGAMMMATAIKQAHTASKLGEVPVGAVIACKNQIIVASHNGVEAMHDPTAHAEMLAIHAATRVLESRYLDTCDLYVTLEPCPMCMYALSLARIRRVYFGAYDERNGAAVSKKLSIEGYFPDCYGGFQERECGKLMHDFFAARR